MEPSNLLLIMSDEHNPKVVGCYGNSVAETPNIDRLASDGTRFSAAYTNCPVCVPARASFATGKYVHQIGYWDNAHPYDSAVESWHHRLRASGHEVVAIGKLHFRSEHDDHGFTDEQIPMHVVEAKGDLLGLIRDELPRRQGAWKMAGMAGPGESAYTQYDRQIAERAQQWLAKRSRSPYQKPWVLFVSFVAPHFPLTAPKEYFDRYHDDPTLPLPKLYEPALRGDHPYLKEYGECFAYDDHFKTRDDVRRALAGYFGLVSFLDANIGRLRATLEDTGLSHKTRVIYVSDHGDNLGSRGLWGKSTMYEESVGVPLVMAGSNIPAGLVVETPVSLVDLHPTILETVGLPKAPRHDGLPGVSLYDLIRGDQPDRAIFSEYHGMGSTAALFMIRDRRYKYVHYLSHPDQLFDLATDPEELCDLIADPGHQLIRERLKQRLLAICDPVKIDHQAKQDQAERLVRNGGREAVIARGDLGFSPPPGTNADFQ